jgi:hypothetical protein
VTITELGATTILEPYTEIVTVSYPYSTTHTVSYIETERSTTTTTDQSTTATIWTQPGTENTTVTESYTASVPQETVYVTITHSMGPSIPITTRIERNITLTETEDVITTLTDTFVPILPRETVYVTITPSMGASLPITTTIERNFPLTLDSARRASCKQRPSRYTTDQKASQANPTTLLRPHSPRVHPGAISNYTSIFSTRHSSSITVITDEFPDEPATEVSDTFTQSPTPSPLPSQWSIWLWMCSQRAARYLLPLLLADPELRAWAGLLGGRVQLW